MDGFVTDYISTDGIAVVRPGCCTLLLHHP